MHRLIVESENDKHVLPATVTTVVFTNVLFNIKAAVISSFFPIITTAIGIVVVMAVAQCMRQGSVGQLKY